MWKVLLALVVVVRIAHADDRDDAKREFNAGQAADKTKDYREAIEHYLRAFGLVPHPFALFNIAADYELLGDLRQAAHFYEKYIAATDDAKDRERVKKLLADLQARPGGLIVHTQPEGARVLVDGKSVGTTPYSANVRGGHHTIVVELEGQREQREISIDFGEPHTETIQLRGQSGAIQIIGAPTGAEVTVDNVPSGTLPVRVPTQPGEHVVAVTMQGYSPYETTVVVQPGSVTEVKAVLGHQLDGTGSPAGKILVYYLLGATGGADLRGNGGYGGIELGLRALKYDLFATIGKTGGTTDTGNVDFVFRYFFTEARFAPFIGVGYSYIKGGAGYELCGGLRFDLVRKERAGVSALVYYQLRTYTGKSSTADAPAIDGGVFMPIAAALEVQWR